jgi:hypothetical protein
MEEATRKYVTRQYNYNRVPNPLLEGLVFASFGPVDGETAKERLIAFVEKIAENEAAKIIEDN